MRKQWMAMLSVIGLAGPAARVEAQAVKAADAGSKDAAKNHAAKKQSIVSPRDSQSKLNLKQESLRKQNHGGGVTNQTAVSETCGKNQNPSGGRQVIKGKDLKQQPLRQQNKGAQKQAYPPQSVTCQTGSKKVVVTKGTAGKQNQNAPAPK